MSQSPGGWASRAASFSHGLLQRPHAPRQPQPWPPASVSPPPTLTLLHWQQPQPSPPNSSTRPSRPEHLARAHTPRSTEALPPGAGFLLQAPVRAVGAVAALAVQPWVSLQRVRQAVNRPSLPFLQRSSHLLQHGRGALLAAELLRCSLGMEMGWVSMQGSSPPPPAPRPKPAGGRDQGM